MWVTGESWSYTNWGTPAGTNTEPNDTPAPENFLHYFVAGTGSYSGWNDLGDFDVANPVDSYIIEVVPEPNTALLLGIGLSALAATSRKRSHSVDTDLSFSHEKETPGSPQPLPVSASLF